MFRNHQQQQNNQKNPFQEKVTGIIIIYPTLMIHLIEVIKIENKNIRGDFRFLNDFFQLSHQ